MRPCNQHITVDLPQGNEFFARVTYRVLHQKLSPKQAIEQVAAESPKFIRDKVRLFTSTGSPQHIYCY